MCALLILAASSVVIAPDASASPIVTFKPAFSAGALGDAATMTDELTFTGSEYSGRPEPLRSLALHLPGGIGGSSTGFSTCEVATLDVTGPQGCAPGSSAGPQGELVGEVEFGTEAVPESAKVLPFFGAGETVNFLAQGSSPVSLEFVMTGSYGPDVPPYGRVLSITVPPVETVPGAPHMGMTSITLALGSSRKEHGLETSSLTIPAECPTGGFEWLANAGFEDASIVDARYRSPCPSGRPTSPVLGQREGIGVVEGEVTVRMKGSAVFVALTSAGTIPDGSEVDTTDGRATIAAATTIPGESQSAEVHGGRSLIHQDPALGQTDLTLSLPLTGCSTTSARHQSSAASAGRRKSRPRMRRLWVSEGGGDWDTTGRYVSTSVEGTSWLTEDQCTDSRVRVASGEVKVHDLIHDRSRVLSAGETYTASRRRPKRRR